MEDLNGWKWTNIWSCLTLKLCLIILIFRHWGCLWLSNTTQQLSTQQHLKFRTKSGTFSPVYCFCNMPVGDRYNAVNCPLKFSVKDDYFAPCKTVSCNQGLLTINDNFTILGDVYTSIIVGHWCVSQNAPWLIYGTCTRSTQLQNTLGTTRILVLGTHAQPEKHDKGVVFWDWTRFARIASRGQYVPVFKKKGPFELYWGHLGVIFPNSSIPQDVFPNNFV